MYSKDFIVSNAKLLREPKLAGVYFLISSDGEIIYIGSSKDVYLRLSFHRLNPKMDFDRWYCIPFENMDYMRFEETDYIKKFCPKNNLKDNPKRLNKNYEPFVFGSKQYKTPLSKDQVVEVIEEIKNHDKNGKDE